MSESPTLGARPAAEPDDADLDARIAAAERSVIERDARVRSGIQAVVAAGRQKAGVGLAIGAVVLIAAAGWLLLKALLPKRKTASESDSADGDRRRIQQPSFLPYAMGLFGPLVARVLSAGGAAGARSPGGNSSDWLLGLILPPLADLLSHRKDQRDSTHSTHSTDSTDSTDRSTSKTREVGRPETSPPLPVRAAVQIDLMRYLGHWYEIARLPTPYERHCLSDVTATYARSATPGLISVVNACRQRNGIVRAARGVAHVVKGSGNARLKVSFAPALLRPLPLVWADYWILAVDADYRHALVGTPDRRSLWILARAPAISITERDGLIGLAREQGYDISALMFTEQGA